MGKIVSGITDAVGLTNTKGEKQAAKAAAQANANAYAMSQEQIELAKQQLDFQKEQYADWNNIYGDIQANLGDYYKSIDPDKLVTMGLEKQQQEFQQVRASIQRDFAQRGLSNSGQEIATTNTNMMQNATTRAAIRANGDQAANEQAMQFLGLGLGQGTQMLGIIGNAAGNANNAYSTGVQSQTSIGNSYLNRSTNYGMQGMANMGSIFSSAAKGYFN